MSTGSSTPQDNKPLGILKVGFMLAEDTSSGQSEEMMMAHKSMFFMKNTTVGDVVKVCFLHGEGTLKRRLLAPAAQMALFLQNGTDVFVFPSKGMRLTEFEPFVSRLQSGESVNLALAPAETPLPETSSEPPKSPRGRTLPPRRNSPNLTSAQPPGGQQGGGTPGSDRPILGAAHIILFTPMGDRLMATLTYQHGETAGRVVEDAHKAMNQHYPNGELELQEPSFYCLKYHQSNGAERVFEFNDCLPVARDPELYPELFLVPSRKVRMPPHGSSAVQQEAAESQQKASHQPVMHRPTTFTEDQLQLDARLEHKEKTAITLQKELKECERRETAAQRAIEKKNEDLRLKSEGAQQKTALNSQDARVRLDRLSALGKQVAALEEQWASAQYAQRDIERLEEQLQYGKEMLNAAFEREAALKGQLHELQEVVNAS